MSCRSCVDGCQCFVVGSTGVTVTGTGTAAVPYVVSVDLCTLINALPQQNREIAANEWIVAQDATGNCIQVRAPADINVQSLSFNGATNVLTLTETDGSVFNVSLASTFVETTTTITYDPGTASWTYTNEVGAVFNLDLCTQLNDLTVAGATNAGDLMVVADPTNAECKLAPIPAPGGSGTVTNITVTDTNSVDLNVTNPTTTPNLTATVRRAFNNDSGIGEGANGIYVRTSANTLNSGTNNFTNWPGFGGLGCTITTQSQRVVRDTNGVIYGEPRYNERAIELVGPAQVVSYLGANTNYGNPPGNITINNTTCRTIYGTSILLHTVFTTANNNGVYVTFINNPNNYGGTPTTSNQSHRFDTPVYRSTITEPTNPFAIAPAANLVSDVFATIQGNPNSPSPGSPAVAVSGRAVQRIHWGSE